MILVEICFLWLLSPSLRVTPLGLDSTTTRNRFQPVSYLSLRLGLNKSTAQKETSKNLTSLTDVQNHLNKKTLFNIRNIDSKRSH